VCFSVYNGSVDGEWLDRVRLTFPRLLGDWNVSCKSQATVDSSGNSVNLNCSTPLGYEVVYSDTNGYPGEISVGSSWDFCVDVTVPGAYNGPRIINWGVSGDEDPSSSAPHEITGTLQIEQCEPLMLKPASIAVEGCNGVTQTHTLDLWNNSGLSGDVNLSYTVNSGNGTLTGPAQFSLAVGEIVTFEVNLKPDLCLSSGDIVTATVTADGLGSFDSSTIVQTITVLSGWEGLPVSPIATMDNVVVWASHDDGGLWSIGGYGSLGATQRYDLEAGTWTTHTPETVITPTIEYPMDGCYGLDSHDHEIVVLFPDTIVTGTLHVYDITADNWYTRSLPVGYPDGRWGQDIVSLLSIPGVEQNKCYISGGSTQPGGGRVKNLWVYYPDTNITIFLNNFSLVETGFDFHASWYVPWVGDQGAICIGGGIDFKSSVVDSTQCYDLDTGTFNSPNADLGPLPEPWWGMADGWQVHNGRYQIWLANGVAQDGSLLPVSAYADELSGGFQYGPGMPVGLYRLEGAGADGRFFVEQGAVGGFSYSDYNHLLVPCPTCPHVYLPCVTRE
jgi:hypothetical protein